VARSNLANHYKARAKRDFRKIIAFAKAQPCEDCNETYPTCVMDFDHVRGEKRFGIAQAIKSVSSTDALINEILKCEVVCANCHRQRT
jgi:hypothetical protein